MSGPDGAGHGLAHIDLDDLLLLVADGNEEAFAELYDRTAHRVLGLSIRIVIDRAQAEKVCQEVFLGIWQNANRYDPARGSVLSWILTATHRQAVDRVRSSHASTDRDRRIGRRDLPADWDQTSDTADTLLEHERVRLALNQLTDAHRQAITLAYYNGYSHTEIAALLRIPNGTVKPRLRDGLIHLRRRLAA